MFVCKDILVNVELIYLPQNRTVKDVEKIITESTGDMNFVQTLQL